MLHSQELTCREELLTLLLSLLPLVWKIPVQEEKAPGQYPQILTLLLMLTTHTSHCPAVMAWYDYLYSWFVTNDTYFVLWVWNLPWITSSLWFANCTVIPSETAFHGPEMFSSFVYLYICFIFHLLHNASPIIKVKPRSNISFGGFMWRQWNVCRLLLTVNSVFSSNGSFLFYILLA